jgi:hypothetical protein
MVEHRLDHAANVEPEPCLRLPQRMQQNKLYHFDVVSLKGCFS